MISIDGHSLNIEKLIRIVRFSEPINLNIETQQAINKSRKTVEELLENNKAVYGINTGFGKLSDTTIPVDELSLLQRNLIMSHAVGAGEPFSIEIVRSMMLLRINSLANGYSGIRLSTIAKLIELVNKGVTPYVPQKGSLGASGDLAPLAHMILPLIGEGKCYYQGELLESKEAFKKANIKHIELHAKEGLALINGTQAMAAVGAITLYDAMNLVKTLDIASSLTLEAEEGIIDAFDNRLHNLRPHKGQIITAQNIQKLVFESEYITHQGDKRVQDSYSLRCIPQIHGAIKDTIKYVKGVLETEFNSVTDNPIVFSDTMEGISGGNFHGEPLAIAFDFLKVALAEIGSISECRIEKLVNPALSNLPAFLTQHGGLNSGFMIVQYASAALVSESKVLAHPASVDSISSSAGQEDHVSMGTIAIRQAYEILKNSRRVVAMELMSSCQAIDLRGVKKLGKGTKVVYDYIRQSVSQVDNDRIMYEDINTIEKMIIENNINKVCEDEIGKLEI